MFVRQCLLDAPDELSQIAAFDPAFAVSASDTPALAYLSNNLPRLTGNNSSSGNDHIRRDDGIW